MAPAAADPPPAVSPLSALITRHGVARPSPPAHAATRVDVEKYLSTPEAGEQAPTPSKPAAPPAKRIKRKKLTLRRERADFRRFRELADRSDRTYQSILEAAILAYPDEAG